MDKFYIILNPTPIARMSAKNGVYSMTVGATQNPSRVSILDFLDLEDEGAIEIVKKDSPLNGYVNVYYRIVNG